MRCSFMLGITLLVVGAARGQYVPAQVSLTQLPSEHAYQRELRAYLGSLTEKDLTVELKKLTPAAGNAEPEDQYRMWLLTLNLPQVEAAALPASAFALKALESAKGIPIPATPAMSHMLAWLAHWDYPGNPYFNSAPLMRRAFVLAAVDTMLLDYLYDHDPKGSDRSDFLGGNLIWLGYTYKHVKQALPAEARRAMETGLKRLVGRLDKWGPRGAMTDMDLFAAVGLRYVSEALGDAEVSKIAEAYVKRLFTEPRFFHPAGYFVDVGCFDTSYNGISLYFATWAALASDWKFAKEAVDKCFRLRALLCLPEPTGGANGPSHMSSRTSADSPHDQWNFPHRPYAAAMVTDEALHLAPLPTADAMKGATERVLQHLNTALAAPRVAKPEVWRESHWSGMLNFAHEHYQKGYYTRRLALEKANSPLLKTPYERKETGLTDYDKAFLISRYDSYTAVIHTGPIRGWPYGFGGGQLSAFWTPASGPLLLGRRKGMQGPVPDKLEEWRTWPVHAVSGLTDKEELFTSAFLAKPTVTTTIKDKAGDVQVEGPVSIGKTDKALQYQRRFQTTAAGLTVRTALQSKPAVKVKELYESLPIFLHDSPQAADAKVVIEFQVEGQWQKATAKPHAKVKAICVERYKGGFTVTLDRARTVQLAPSTWTDGFQTRATCQTVLIHLLENAGQAQMMEAASVEYTLTPASGR